MPITDESSWEIAAEDLARARLSASPPLLVDVRDADERLTGVLDGACHVPLAELERRMPELAVEPDREVVVYCASGRRSADGTRLLRGLGYRTARSLRGGITEWRRCGLPVAPAPDDPAPGLDARQLERYARQIRLPGLGIAGQQRLLGARVLCVGAGGLGSPACLYLAAAGVGELGIVDDDIVALSNLQRQILHTTDRVGVHKTRSAAQTLAALNPEVRVRSHRLRLDAANAPDLLAGYDVVLDGSDNFATRYVVNDAAVRLCKPVVFGAVLRYEGQVGVFGGAPCYRCLFPVTPPPDAAPSCGEAGVLGVVPGVVGTLQATEALKHLLGLGESLRGRLLTFDALSMRFSTLTVRADPTCPACGEGKRASRAPCTATPGG